MKRVNVQQLLRKCCFKEAQFQASSLPDICHLVYAKQAIISTFPVSVMLLREKRNFFRRRKRVDLENKALQEKFASINLFLMYLYKNKMTSFVRLQAEKRKGREEFHDH